MNSIITAPQTRPGRRLTPLLALVAILALPMLAAIVLYFNQDWLPQSSTNRGELIQPPRPLGDRQLVLVGGSGLDLNSLAGQWVMLVVSDPNCTEICRRRTHDVRQVHLATGKDQERVTRLLWFAGIPADNAVATQLRAEYPQMSLVQRTSDSNVPDLFPASPEPGDVYIIDPFGNLMMRYRIESPAGDILKDLKRLLRISRDWR